MVTRRPTFLVALVTLVGATAFVFNSSAQAPKPAPKPKTAASTSASAKASAKPTIDTAPLEPIPLPPPPPPVSTASAMVAPSASAPPPPVAVGPMTVDPSVVHAPIAVAKPHEPLDIAIDLSNAHLAKRIVLVYQHDNVVEETPLLRNNEGWVARIPGEHVNPPGLAYAIEIETADGRKIPAFASRKALHPVQVPDDVDDLREHHLLGRLDNRRSIVRGSFDYVYYGKSTSAPDASGRNMPVRDEYLRAELSYFYRPLRHVLEFGIRVGIVRGRSPIGTAADGSEYGSAVGLNYGSPTAIFRVHDLFHIEASLLTSVTEIGFSGGMGGALHIGDPYGSKLVLGGETIKTFGSRGWARLDIVRGRVRVSPVVEVGDIPNARPGVRLFAELGFTLPEGFLLALRGGYQARDFTSGGASGGLTFGYAF